MPKVTANNCEMYYEVDDYTDPWVTEKETVWLQHGVGRSTKFWYHWVPALARHYRVVRRDMRGHGQSADPGPNHTWSIDELITDMRAFMDALGLQQVHYVGESIGGILGVAFAVRWPERLKSLTICNSPTAIRAPAETEEPHDLQFSHRDSRAGRKSPVRAAWQRSARPRHRRIEGMGARTDRAKGHQREKSHPH